MSTRRQAAVSRAISALAPMMPREDAQIVRALVARPHMRALDAGRAVWLAAVTHIRHAHTDYDVLMEEGYDRDAARFFVRDDINAVLQRWQATRLLDADEDDPVADMPAPDRR